jgi:hypothetical protein
MSSDSSHLLPGRNPQYRLIVKSEKAGRVWVLLTRHITQKVWSILPIVIHSLCAYLITIMCLYHCCAYISTTIMLCLYYYHHYMHLSLCSTLYSTYVVWDVGICTVYTQSN